jgi:hypothetical protein
MSRASRYSHVRMEAKRRALDEIAARQGAADEKRKTEGERGQHTQVVTNQQGFSKPSHRGASTDRAAALMPTM